jgi:hypothetical protein
MKAYTAVVGAVALLAATGQSALAMPTDQSVHHRCRTATPSRSISFCNPLGRTRGPGAGLGRL